MRNILAVRYLSFVLVAFAMCSAAFGQVGISIRIGPPALPVYEQPPCPAEGYIWTPGYWAYDYDYGDYYWVPGTWVLAPEPGFFWTPAYWGWGAIDLFSMKGIGVRESVSMAELTTATVTSDMATKADDGTTTVFSTTVQ